MPGKTEDLRHAEAGGDPDLNFTYNELMSELAAEHAFGTREPGDVTPREMSDVTNLTERQWYKILNEKVRQGELQKLKVKDKEDHWPYYVYRKAKNR